MNKKIIKTILISLVLIFIFNINSVLAFEECDSSGGDICYKPEIAIPGFSEEVKVSSSLLGEYISVLYQYLLYVAGVLAVVVIMVAGFQWITAGGNQSKIGEAKERVMGAIIGLFLALGSYLLLFTINPELVKIHDLNMPSIIPFDDDQKCLDGQMVRPSNSPESSLINGKLASCGEEYTYTVDGNEHKCYGIFCSVGSKLCYNDKCIGVKDICSKLGELELDNAPKVGLTEIPQDWYGNLESFDRILAQKPAMIGYNYCMKYFYFSSGECNYITGYANEDEIWAKTDLLNSGIMSCESMDVRDATELLACQRSTECKPTVLNAAGNFMSVMADYNLYYSAINSIVGFTTKCKDK